MRVRSSLALLIALACAGTAMGQTQIARWSFNGVSPSLSSDNGLGTSSVLGGLTQLFDGGSPNDAVANNQSMRLQQFSGTAPSGSQGAQFNVSTVGFNTVTVTWDQRHSNSASRFTQFSYSIDGSTFITAGLPDNGLLSYSFGDSWALARTVDLSTIPGVNNNPNFRFRLTAVHDPSTGAYAAAADGATFAVPLASERGEVILAPQFGADFLTFATRPRRGAGGVRLYALRLADRTGLFPDGRKFRRIDLSGNRDGMAAFGPYTVLTGTQGLLLVGSAAELTSPTSPTKPPK